MLASFTRARIFRFGLLGTLALFCAFVPSAARATDPGAQASQTVLAFCNANLQKFQSTLAETKTAPQVPVPPEVSPPCKQCYSTNAGPSEADTTVAGFVNYSEEPEVNDIKILAGIQRQVAYLVGFPQLDPAAQKCLSQFDPDTITGAISRSVDHLFNGKAIPMAQQYKKDTKRAYAGIRLLTDIGQKKQLIEGYAGQNSQAAADGQQVLDLAQDWAANVADSVDHDIFSTHKYNLCPVYAGIFKSLELLGGPATNMDAFTKAIQKMDDQLHFDIAMELHGTSPSGSGGSYDATWNIKSTLYLDIGQQGCYTPKLDNNDNLQVSVENFSMNANGVAVRLVSPRQFTVPVSLVTFNWCDQNPKLSLHFTSYGPLDEISAKGGDTKISLFASNLQAAVNAPIVNSVSGSGSGSGGGGSDSGGSQQSSSSGSSGSAAPSPSPSPTANAAVGALKQKMQALAAEIQAHKSDTSWILGPQGQAAIAQMQTLATQQATSAENSAGPGLAGALKNAGTLVLNWSNGTTDPVDQDVRLSSHGVVSTLHVTIKQAPH